MQREDGRAEYPHRSYIMEDAEGLIGNEDTEFQTREDAR